MRAADWVAVVVLGAALVGGGAYVVMTRARGPEGKPLPGGQSSAPAAQGMPLPQPQPQASNNTMADVKAGLGLARDAIALGKDLWGSIEAAW